MKSVFNPIFPKPVIGFGIIISIMVIISSIQMLSCDETYSDSTASETESPTEEHVIVIEDQGEICIQGKGTRISAIINPQGCYSSSIHCTEVIEQSGDMTINRNDNLIQFHAKFIIRDTSANQTCYGDCGGAGNLVFDHIGLSPGTYTVSLGTTEFGEIYLPIDIDHQQNTNSICFDGN